MTEKQVEKGVTLYLKDATRITKNGELLMDEDFYKSLLFSILKGGATVYTKWNLDEGEGVFYYTWAKELSKEPNYKILNELNATPQIGTHIIEKGKYAYNAVLRLPEDKDAEWLERVLSSIETIAKCGYDVIIRRASSDDFSEIYRRELVKAGR